MTISHPIKVTVQNNEPVPACGLTLSVRLLDKDLGTPIGSAGTTKIERINADTNQEISGYALTTLRSDGQSVLDNAACIATLKVGSLILDEWRFELSS